jgi:formate dehydrogenase iron-sulfur subunit
MYVLHHADKPSIYAGLPENPKISATVEFWKGLIKPVALAGIAASAVAGFLHWVITGPNEVQPEDEKEAEHVLAAEREKRGSDNPYIGGGPA